MNKLIIKVKIRISGSVNEFTILITNSARNKAIAAVIDPRDTNLLSQTVTMKTEKAITVGIGARAIKTPADVATPFPPLNLRKIVKI